ncbi:hypothetical protein E3J85_01175 [Patescibacteria group bacterium]|nr:MAG: hypothetical protein E3J85_01175 [Patescibacteria group bacterium]
MEDKIKSHTKRELFLCDKGASIILIFAFLCAIGGDNLVQSLTSSTKISTLSSILPLVLLFAQVITGWLIFYSQRGRDQVIKGFWTAVIVILATTIPFLYLSWRVDY